MLTDIEAEKLLTKPESPTLDFKRSLYDFNIDPDKANASLVKDVCSMINTIRDHTSYILFGVNAQPDKPPIIFGLTNVLDDVILQDKVKLKVSPSPEFKFYNILVKGLLLGIIEFPVRHYELPVTPTINMKGIVAGQVYYRAGSTNTEARGMEAIRIADWIRSLPKASSVGEKNKKLHSLLIELQNTNGPLSQTIAKLYSFGKELNLKQIIRFCEYELKGLSGGFQEKGELDYRLTNVFMDLEGAIEINLYQYTAAQIKDAFMQEKHLIKGRLHVGRTCLELEDMLSDMNLNKYGRIATLNSSTHKVIQGFTGKDILVRVYIFPDDLLGLLRSIRKHAIELVLREL